MKRLITVTQLCLRSLEIVSKLIFSSWFSYDPPHSMYAFMLLFNKQLVPSFRAGCTAHPPPSISSSLSTCKGGIPCMCPFASQEPHSAFLIKHLSSLFVSQRSLPLVPWLARTRWWMDGAFVSEVFIVSLHYSSSHRYTKVSWNSMIFFGNH